MAAWPLIGAGVGLKLRRHHGRSWRWLRHDRRAKALMLLLLRGEGLLQVGWRVEAGWMHLWRVPEVGSCRGRERLSGALDRPSGFRLSQTEAVPWWRSGRALR